MKKIITPKEKAKELICKFQSGYKNSDGFNYQFNIDEEEAEQCALIVVNEILSLGYTNKSDFKVYDFYSKVKIEIEKL